MATSAPVPAPTDPGLRRRSWLRTATLVPIAVGTVAAVTVALGDGSGFHAPQGRSMLEVTGAIVVLLSALVLAIPSESDVSPARNAFTAALVVLAVSNGVFGLLPLSTGDPGVRGDLAFYPWLAARYLTGTFFVCAGLERPRARLSAYLAAALGLLAVVEVALVVVGAGLTVPVHLARDPYVVVVSDPTVHVIVQALPVVLFGLGAWLAGRLYVRTGATEYGWLSAALTTQVVAQVHEMLFPAFLGPVLRSADVFRAASFGLLSLGAFTQMRRLYRHRSHAVQQQEHDLQVQRVLNERLWAFADREADFRAVVTHELATPLAAIGAFAHAARKRAGEHGDPELRRVLEGIGAEARRLQQLAARMDELRELEHRRFECELRPVLVEPLLHEAARFVEGLPGGHPVTVAAEPARVEADPVRFGQAVRNVLTNAATYSPRGSPIVIGGRAEGDGAYRVTVDDAGPGIPVTDRSRVLRRYARGAAAGGQRGQGLGLYVASGIVAAHGGALEIADGPGGGTRVIIRIRLATLRQGHPSTRATRDRVPGATQVDVRDPGPRG